MPNAVCSHCGCSEIDYDPARGDAVCTKCGSVLDDQIIVSEVQFAEHAGGGSSIIGQFVSADESRSHSMGGNFHVGVGKESRAITLENGRRKIQQLGAQLHMNQHCLDTAVNFFKMAVVKRLTRGRKSLHVIAACLYLVCRTEGTPHMLLDFSDVLQTNVYVLGKVYNQLARELCIVAPAIDPCLYIARFAHKLQLGEKEHEVSMTALRLVQRMKRDWMHTGRRPSGLCGAALLVACRIFGFNRTVKNLIHVVKVCESTIRKRLNEFEGTPSSQLTIEEFSKIDLEQEMDPPSFSAGSKKRKIEQTNNNSNNNNNNKLEDSSKLSELTSEVTNIQKEIEKALEARKPRGIFAAYSKVCDDIVNLAGEAGDGIQEMYSLTTLQPDSKPDQPDSQLSLTTTTTTTTTTATAATAVTTTTPPPPPPPPSESETNVDTSTNAESASTTITTTTTTTGGRATETDIELGADTTENKAKNAPEADSNFEPVSTDNDDPHNHIARKVEEKLCSLVLPEFKGPAPTAASLGIRDCVAECLKEAYVEEVLGVGAGAGEGNPEGDGEDGELDLTDINDEELDRFLLSENEVRVKTKIWMEANADYLKEQQIKEALEAKEREEAASRPEKKKKKTYKRKSHVQASTAGEAIRTMLQEKKISSKINYEVLKDLCQPASGAAGAGGATTPHSTSSSSPSLFRGLSSASSLRLKRPGSVMGDPARNPAAGQNHDDADGGGGGGGVLTPPRGKKVKILSQVAIADHRRSALSGQANVVVETGPVIYETGPEDEEEEEEEEEEDYEGIQHLSAAQLMGHGNPDVYDDDDHDPYDVYE
ncbi:transcription factor IIIB 90 kDa subunit-like [Argonauta hians]